MVLPHFINLDEQHASHDVNLVLARRLLRDAALTNDVRKIQELADTSLDVNSAKWTVMNDRVESLLTMCLERSYSDCAEYLIMNHTNFYEDEDVPIETLAIAAARGRHSGVFNLLLEQWFMIFDKGKGTNYAPFIGAAQMADFERLEDMLTGKIAVSDEITDEQALRAWLTTKLDSNLPTPISTTPAPILVERKNVTPGLILGNLLTIYGCPASCLEALLEHDVDLSVKRGLQLLPLVCAVIAENHECITFLLEQYEELQGRIGKHLFTVATSLRSPASMMTLLEILPKTDLIGCPAAFFNACYYGNLETLVSLLKFGYELDEDRDGYDPIFAAVHSGSPECTRYIIKNLPASTFEWAIDEAPYCHMKTFVSQPKCLDIVLRHFKFDVDRALGEDEDTLLIIATRHDFLDSIDVLLGLKADIDLQNRAGLTALATSCKTFSNDTTKALIMNGADLEIRDKRGNTAVMHAAYAGDRQSVSMLMRVGARLNAMNSSKDTALSMAVCNDDANIIKLLLTHRQVADKRSLKSIHRHALTDGSCWEGTCSVEVIEAFLEKKVFEPGFFRPHMLSPLVDAMMNKGLGPADFNLKLDHVPMSPLIGAFMMNECDVIRTIVKKRFYFPKDLKTLRTNKFARKSIWNHGSTELMGLMNGLCRAPHSLAALCVINVSYLLSKNGGNEYLVQKMKRLPCPETDKLALRFDLKHVTKKSTRDSNRPHRYSEWL